MNCRQAADCGAGTRDPAGRSSSLQLGTWGGVWCGRRPGGDSRRSSASSLQPSSQSFGMRRPHKSRGAGGGEGGQREPLAGRRDLWIAGSVWAGGGGLDACAAPVGVCLYVSEKCGGGRTQPCRRARAASVLRPVERRSASAVASLSGATV